MTGDRRPEHELLLRCATSRLTPSSRERIDDLVKRGICWDLTLDLADQHRVLPLLYWSLSAIEGVHVPSPVMKTLAEAFRANALWNMRLAGVLVGLSEAAAAHAVRLITWKGPAHAVGAYGHIGLRMFSDLDLLVTPSDLERASAVLSAFGLRPDATLADVPVQPFNGPGELLVELHWAPTPWPFAGGLRTEDLRCEEIRIADRPVVQPSPADLLILLCAHGTKHGWDRLRWIVDVAELLKARPDLDWDRAHALAARSGTRRMLSLGLTVTRQALDVTLPAAAEPLLHDAVAARLSGILTRRLFNVAPGPPRGNRARLRNFLVQLGLKERPRDQLRYAFGLPIGRLYRISTQLIRH